MRPRYVPAGPFEPFPDCASKDECEDKRQRAGSAMFPLWFWARAMRRLREPRKRVLATLIAHEVRRAAPRKLDRREIARQERRQKRLNEIKMRPGVVTWDEAWRVFQEEEGDEPISHWKWPPRTAKERISELDDRAIESTDNFLHNALKAFFLDPTDETHEFWARVAEQRIEEAELLPRVRPGPIDWGLAVVAFGASILQATSLYQMEVARGHLPRAWYCFGCERWHFESRGAPSKYRSALIDMTLDAVRVGA